MKQGSPFLGQYIMMCQLKGNRSGIKVLSIHLGQVLSFSVSAEIHSQQACIWLAGWLAKPGLKIQNTEMPLGRISSIIAPPGKHFPLVYPVLYRGYKSFPEGKNELHKREMHLHHSLYPIRKSHADEYYIVFLVPSAAKLSFTTPTQSLTPLI